MERFATIVNGFEQLTTVAKLSILDACGVLGTPWSSSNFFVKGFYFNKNIWNPEEIKQNWTGPEKFYLLLRNFWPLLLIFFISGIETGN